MRNGSCLGLFLFATLVTLLMLLLLMIFTKSPKGAEMQQDPDTASHDAALESLGLPRGQQADYIFEGDMSMEEELRADPEERIQWLLLTGR